MTDTLASYVSQLPSCFDALKNDGKPIVLYGMGDGADKILNVCEAKGIRIDGVFASDGFVRDKMFRGHHLESYSSLRERFGKMTVLVSFASRLPDVMEKIRALEETDDLYAPDVPVFGEGLFDMAYFKEHADELEQVYASLSDEQSRSVMRNIVAYKITGRIGYLAECETEVDESYDTIIRPKDGSTFLDVGAYNGDTVSEYIEHAGKHCRAVAFEPDERNFRKLSENIASMPLASYELHNAAAWDADETRTFFARSGRNSAASTVHKKAKTVEICCEKIDTALGNEHIDFVNIDAEGSDMRVIEGMRETIARCRPTLLCAVYHRNEDLFAIPTRLMELYGEYELYLRHFPYIPGWDTNIYIKPKRN